VRLQNCAAARSEVFNIGSTEEVEIVQLAKLVIELLNSKSAIEFLPYQEAYAPGFQDMLRRKPVIEKLGRYTNFIHRRFFRESYN